MNVEIISNEGSKTFDCKSGVVKPWYLYVMYIEHHKDKLVFRILGKYKTTKDYDTEDLWIINDDEEDIKTIERLDRQYGIRKVPHPLM